MGLPLVRPQTLQSEAAGPRPDGHGLFAAILGWSVGQELSFDTLTLSLVSKLTKFQLFLFLFFYLGCVLLWYNLYGIVYGKVGIQ